MGIDKNIDEFNSYLLSLKNNKVERKKEKFNKMSKWLKAYKNYLEFEEKFNPKKLIKYSRGSVIKVNLGFNVGNELGGVHFAVVLDNNNSKSSGTVTVVPLSSKKQKDKESEYIEDLGEALNVALQEKLEKVNSKAIENGKKIQEEALKLKSMVWKLKQENNSIIKKYNRIILRKIVLTNPNEHGYYLKDKGEIKINPQGNMKGLGSLPNNVFDKIYEDKEGNLFYEQNIDRTMLDGSEKWEIWKQNDEKVIFKINEFAAPSGLNEVTTICNCMISRTFEEIDKFELGVFQGGATGDLLICINKSDLKNSNVEGFKDFLFDKSKAGNSIEIYYKLKKSNIVELPAFTEEELKNISITFEKENKNLQNLMKNYDYIAIRENECEKMLLKSIKDLENLKEQNAYQNKMLEELNRISIGSKALVGQITTISKLRIIDPKHANDVLSGIKIEGEDLKKIDKRIKKLFFK